jgi:hypothetical protein
VCSGTLSRDVHTLRVTAEIKSVVRVFGFYFVRETEGEGMGGQELFLNVKCERRSGKLECEMMLRQATQTQARPHYPGAERSC